MSIHRRTNAFLELADENKDLAHWLMGVEDPPRRWVAVIAFYASVHYIGAYHWENDGQYTGETISNHDDRDKLVHRDWNLIPIAPHYLNLFNHGYWARYKTIYKARLERVRELVETDLRRIELCVKSHLV